MDQESHSPQDEFIRERLSSNLEAYTNNAILNKLTPNRTKNTMLNKDDSKNGSRSSSLKRSTTTSASKKSTPSWNKRYPKRNDSNIVTSPVKTLRQFGGESSDEYDTTTNYDEDNGTGNHESTTINVPLKSSPKKPLRKGTPKLTKTKQRESKSPRKPIENEPKKELEKGKGLESSFREKSAPIEGTTAVGGHNSSSRRIFINGHVNHNISTHDDDDDYGAHHNSNNTLLSEIPSDILSPEKHIYPPENLRRSSSNISSAVKAKEPTRSLLSSIPIISPPKSKKLESIQYHQEVHTSTFEKLLNSNAKENRGREDEEIIGSSANRGTSLPPSLYPSIGEPDDDEFDDEPSEKKIVSDIIDSRVIAKERDTISERKRKESESISIFFQKSSSKSPVLSDGRRSLVSPKNQESPRGTTVKSIPRDNTSYHHLSEFIKNPLINHDKYKPVESPKKVALSSDLHETKLDSQPGKDTTRDTQHRRSSHVLDLSQFESSDEEPVPELTVPLGEEPEDQKEEEENIGVKRSFEPIETSTNKRIKSSLYPTLPSESPTKRSDPPVSKSLYPQMKPFLVNSADISSTEPQPQQRLPPGPQRVRQLREEEAGEVEEPLGDADNWTKSQWKTFFQAFKRFKRTNDLSIFSTRLLEYLRCDQHEIKLKIQFALDYEDTLRKKRA